MEPVRERSTDDPADRDPADRKPATPSTAPAAAAHSTPASGRPNASDDCPLCGTADEEASVTFGDYATAQHDLLGYWLATELRVTDFDSPMHRACLEDAERSLQAAQLLHQNDDTYFVDFSLGRTPILPTPIRMDADLRFTGRGITIAFIDSGFVPHTEFVLPHNRILAAFDAVRGREIRRPDRLGAGEPPVEAWHGTMAAATAAGSGHASGGDYRGIASEARLVLVKAMTHRYRIRTPQVVRALEWIRDNRVRLDIRVVNMSVGVDETTDSMSHPVIALVEELSAAGVVMVAASGNNPANPIKPPGAAPSAITVGGYNDNNSVEWMRREIWHSSYGNTPGGARKPELLAPSIWVAAPILDHTAVKAEAVALFSLAASDDATLMAKLPALAPETGVAERLLAATGAVHARSIVLARIAAEKLITRDYKHVDGTSFAAPIVSSVVAQMLEARPELTPAQVKHILCSTASLLPNIPPEVQGHGVVEPSAALEASVKYGM